MKFPNQISFNRILIECELFQFHILKGKSKMNSEVLTLLVIFKKLKNHLQRVNLP